MDYRVIAKMFTGGLPGTFMGLGGKVVSMVKLGMRGWGSLQLLYLGGGGGGGAYSCCFSSK